MQPAGHVPNLDRRPSRYSRPPASWMKTSMQLKMLGAAWGFGLWSSGFKLFGYLGLFYVLGLSGFRGSLGSA